MKNKTTILIVEDEPNISHFVSTTLNLTDFHTIECHSGKDAIYMTSSYCPDLILLDLGLPDIDGIEVLKTIRKWSAIPVIVISARLSEDEKVTALETGADDYITKPFGTKELIARIKTALRHTIKVNNDSLSRKCYRYKDLVIDFEKRSVKLKGEDIHVTRNEYQLLSLLAENCGKVLTYDNIILKIWGPYADNDNKILRVNMANIRRKIEENPAIPTYIFTEVGVGYRMAEEPVNE